MPEKLDGETGGCNESNRPSILVSHSSNSRMGKIGTRFLWYLDGQDGYGTLEPKPSPLGAPNNIGRSAQTWIGCAVDARKSNF